MNEKPLIEHTCLAFRNGQTGAKTVVIQDEIPSDQKLASVASVAFLDMAKLSDMDEREFLKLVVEQYNTRKENTFHEVVE